MRIWIIALLFFFFGLLGKKIWLNHIFKHYGICTEAVVYQRKRGIGSRGSIITYYKFVWKGTTYYGNSTVNTKYRQTDKFFLSSDDLLVGDTIVVVFFEKNPTINVSNTGSDKECDLQ
jgi:hypothetical protein